MKDDSSMWPVQKRLPAWLSLKSDMLHVPQSIGSYPATARKLAKLRPADFFLSFFQACCLKISQRHEAISSQAFCQNKDILPPVCICASYAEESCGKML